MTLALFFISFFALAQDLATPPAKTAEIQGTVIEATSNAPIPRALIILRKGTDPGVGTYSNSAGKFTFHLVSPGAYLISVERTGFVGRASSSEQQTITIEAAGDTPAPVTFKLNRTGVISGRVVDFDGEPITGVSVQVLPLKARKSRPAFAGYGMSDDRGYYRAYNIPPGKYKLSATYSQQPRQQQVRMQSETPATKEETPTESYGTTYYPGTLDSSQATSLQLEPGADLQGIDIRLLRTNTVHVRGRVTEAGGGPSTPLVLVVLSPLGGGIPNDVQVQPDGSFDLSEVVPGKYILAAMGMLQQGAQLTSRQPLEVGGSNVEGLQLVVGRAQTVTGAVIVPPDRKLPSGLLIVLHSREESNQFSGQSTGGFAQLKQNGAFSSENVAPGDYDLIVANAGQSDDLYVSSIRSGDEDILASGLHVGSSAPPPIEVTLKGTGAQIDCSVIDAKKKPAPETHIMLLPDPPRQTQLALRAECQTDASGKCSLLGIAPGDYHAIAYSKDTAVDLFEPGTLARIEKSGKSITVKEGDHNTIQLDLLPPDDLDN